MLHPLHSSVLLETPATVEQTPTAAEHLLAFRGEEDHTHTL